MLSGFLLASSLLLTDTIAIYYHIERFSPHPWNINYPYILFFSPMLYLFIKAVIDNQVRMKRRDWLHLIPFFVLYLIMFARFYRLGGGEKLEIIRDKQFILTPIILTSWACCEIQFIVYALIALNSIRLYRQKLKAFYSSLEKVSLSWLNLIIYGFIGWRVVYMLGNLLPYPSDAPFMQGLQFAVETGFLIFATALVYKALTSPVVFPNMDSPQKYRTSPLNHADKKRYLIKIETYMKTMKPYRNPYLTLGDLSRQSSVPIRYVSQILNELLSQNFYDYINRYRIEEVKEVLSGPSGSDRSILQVLYEVGFNSKSVFNAAFKKQVGMTPREFRDRHR
jgi:AraC-like DNA-binding protein